MANFLQKGLINLNRAINPEFNKFWNEYSSNSLDFQKSGLQQGITSAWDSSFPIPLDMAEYGINYPSRTDQNKNLEQRKSFLSYDQMWDFYKYNSLIRACVDTKVKQIVSLNWSVMPKDKHILELKRLSKKEEAERLYIEELLYNPNDKDESFQTLLSKVLTDLLIYDAGIFLIIFDENDPDKPIGLEALHAPDIRYLTNKKREIIGFCDVKHKKIYAEKEIIYLKYYGNTKSFYGLPPIESIMPELIGDIYSMIYNNKYFSENEIPDGLLYLGDMDQVNYDRAKSMFRAYKAKHYAVRMIAGKNEPKWVNFKASNKDMQFTEMQDRLRKRIMTVYQINDTELGYTSDVNKSASEIQRQIFSNKGLKPLIKLIEYHLNTEFVARINKKYIFNFDRLSELRDWEEYKQVVTQTDLMKVQFFNLLYSEGKITLNEYRNFMNGLTSIKEVTELKPFDFGDRPITSGGYSYLENTLKLSEREASQAKAEEMKQELGKTHPANISLDDFVHYLDEIDSKGSQKLKADILENIIREITPNSDNTMPVADTTNNKPITSIDFLDKIKQSMNTGKNVSNKISEPTNKEVKAKEARLPQNTKQNESRNTISNPKKIKIKRTNNG